MLFRSVGVIAFFLMRALGELVLHRPTSGAFVSYMREFYGEAGAYVTGWMYWLNWALTGIAELSAVGLYMQYWFPNLPAWATVLVALAVVLAINLLSARAFGEFEFWAAILKVAAIVVFLVVGLVVVIGLVREVFGDLPVITYTVQQQRELVGSGTGHAVFSALGVFVLLKAFANGGASLTGLEAISNGVSAFKRPEGPNARRTLSLMSALLGTLVLGISFLAWQTRATPYKSGSPTVISQVAQTWLQLAELDERLVLARQALASRTESLRIYTRRVEVGATSRLALTQVIVTTDATGKSVAIPPELRVKVANYQSATAKK